MSFGVTVDFNANLARFTSGVDKALNDLNRFESNASRIGRNVSQAFSLIGASITVGGIAAAVKATIDLQDHLNDLSKVTTLSARALAGLSGFAEQSGTDLDGAAKSVSFLAKEMGKAPEKFRALGIAANDPLKAFGQLSDVFNSIDDPQRRAAFAATALGKSWESAAPLLAEGSTKMAAMIDKFTKLSGVTEQSVKNADEFNDKLTELQKLASGFIVRAANPIVEGLLAINREFEISQNKSASWAKVLVTSLAAVAKVYSPGSGAMVDSAAESAFGALDKFTSPGGAGRDTGNRKMSGSAVVPPPTPKLVDDFIGNNKSGGGRAGGGGKSFDAMTAPSFRRLSEAMKVLEDEWRGVQQVVDDASRVFNETRTPMERLSAAYEHLNSLVSVGAITQETYSRAVAAAQAEFDDSVNKSSKALDKFAENAAKNIQDSLADWLFDPFKDGVDGMIGNFERFVRRAAAEAAAADLTKRLFGSFGGGSGEGVLGGIVGSLFGGGTQAPAPGGDFRGLKLPSFAVGTDYVPRDMIAQIHQGERIVPANQNSGGGVTINFAITGAVDQRSQTQIARMTGTAVQRAMRRDG